MVPFQVSSQRRSSSVPHLLPFPFSCLYPWRVAWFAGSSRWTGGRTARCPWVGPGCQLVWRRSPLGGGGGGVAAWSGSFCRCSAFQSAVAAGDVERGCMGWYGSVACCWVLAASRCWMAGRTSQLSSHGQLAAAHVLSGEAGGRCGCGDAERCTIGWATRAHGGVLALLFRSP